MSVNYLFSTDLKFQYGRELMLFDCWWIPISWIHQPSNTFMKFNFVFQSNHDSVLLFFYLFAAS